jgi:hypothetical protein
LLRPTSPPTSLSTSTSRRTLRRMTSRRSAFHGERGSEHVIFKWVTGTVLLRATGHGPTDTGMGFS